MNWIGGLRSQLKPNYWEFELANEEDLELKDYLKTGINEGFRVIDKQAPVKSYFCENYNSVLFGESTSFINDLIVTELLQDKFILSDHKPICVHALGAVLKKEGGYRPITDCKRPLQQSINNYMEETFKPFTYKTSDQVCEEMTPGCYMATVDIKQAYRTVSVHPQDREYMGISWRLNDDPCYLLDTRLAFGLRCAPYVFTRISDFVSKCMARKGFKVLNYIDDFWIKEETFASCAKAQMELIVLLGRMGFSIAWSKCTSPSQKCVYLGLEFNSKNMTISLPKEKLIKLHKELEFFVNKTRATKHQIRRLAGVLSHSARVIRGGRTFSRRILNLLKGMKEGNPRIYLNEGFHLDLQWWRNCYEIFNGSCSIIKYNFGNRNIVCSDASLNGYGLTFNNDWMAGYFNTSLFPTDVHQVHSHHWSNVYLHGDGNINVLELVPILIAARYFGPRWENFHIVCHSDNTQVVGAINKGVSINKLSMSILRELFWLSVKYNFYLTARHIAGISNVVPDLLSRVSSTNTVKNSLCTSMCCR